jgi:amidohydrolase
MSQTNNTSLLDAIISQQLDQWIAIRHHIHAHPELSFQEYNTASYISKWLTEWEIPHKTGIAGTGIVAILTGKNPSSRTIAFRADMDALPIQEQNTTDYTSTVSGVMHACGHDVHTTCLLGTAYVLKQFAKEWSGTIKLIFQPGEEKHPGGASLMIKEGVLENPTPDVIFGLHVYPHLPYGKVGFREGLYMASADEIYIHVKGKGGHAALPHQTIDPILIASHLIVSLQQIISRNCNPLQPSVLSFGKITGGHVGNVIPNEVHIEGTLRCMDEQWRAKAHQLIEHHAKTLCQAMGGEAEVKIPTAIPVCIIIRR